MLLEGPSFCSKLSGVSRRRAGRGATLFLHQTCRRQSTLGVLLSPVLPQVMSNCYLIMTFTTTTVVVNIVIALWRRYTHLHEQVHTCNLKKEKRK